MQDLRAEPYSQPSRGSGFLYHWYRFGLCAIPLIFFASVFVSLSLSIQSALELKRFHAQGMSGAIVMVGMLRDVGPLTVGMAWIGRTAVFISEETNELARRSIPEFILPRYLAALVAAMHLTVLGLVVGIGSAGVFAPLIAATSTEDFMESTRTLVTNKDIYTFFFKSIIIYPVLAAAVGTYGARLHEKTPNKVALTIGLATISGSLSNLVVTWAFFLA